MLSEIQGLTREQIRCRPMLDEPRTIRIRFRKVGNLQYISHLDLQRTIHRIFVRSGIPVWYTKGFNPHIKIIFSTPLSIGMESECEMLDFRVEREISCDEIRELINREVTDEMRILEVYEPKEKFSSYVWAEYQMEFVSRETNKEIAVQMCNLTKNEHLLATKITKSGIKEYDMLPGIHRFFAEYDPNAGSIRMKAMLNMESERYLNPGALLEILCEKCGLSMNTDASWTIHRLESYKQDGITKFR